METRNIELSLGIEGRAVFLNIKKTPGFKGHNLCKRLSGRTFGKFHYASSPTTCLERAVVQRYGWESRRVGTGFVAGDACIDF